MPWRVVERKSAARRREAASRPPAQWDSKYGPDNWAVGYVIEGEFVLQEQALESVYDGSYESHFRDHPEDLRELLTVAKVLRNPHAKATTGVDLQVPAIMKYLDHHGLELVGQEVVDIGTWQGERSHPISVRLSPLQVRCILDPKLTLEEWWQSKKCLAVWYEG